MRCMPIPPLTPRATSIFSLNIREVILFDCPKSVARRHEN